LVVEVSKGSVQLTKNDQKGKWREKTYEEKEGGGRGKEQVE